MPCLINNIYNLNLINECGYSIPGIVKLYVAPFSSDVFSKLTIFNNQITAIDASVKFTEIEINKNFSKYTEVYNYDTKKYEQTLTVEIVKLDWAKRQVIDSLIKANLMFIFKDSSGRYFYLGEKSGMISNSYTATTDFYLQNRSTYLFTFFGKSDYSPFGFSSDLIQQITDPDCSDLWGAQPTFVPLFWTQYQNCIVSDFPDFVEP